ncbi:MAG: hypothetical protein D3923_02305 [Candidatus Electrothrix sp. AR3]|nr:hypothetical protein [Candidatus Electrothrix sp. AR3]
MIQIMFSLLVALCVTLCFVSVGQSAMQQYQKENFIAVKGRVEKMYTASPLGTKKTGLHLKIRTSTAFYIIHVCPQWYVDKHPEQFNFTTDDVLTVSGAQFRTGRTGNNIYASTILNHSSESTELHLRDPDTGRFILWLGRFKGEIKNVFMSDLEDNIKRLQENVRINVLSSYNRQRNVHIADGTNPQGVRESYSYIP